MLAGFNMQDRTFSIESVSTQDSFQATNLFSVLSYSNLFKWSDWQWNWVSFSRYLFLTSTKKELLIEPLRDWNQSQIVKFFTIPIPILHPMLVHLNAIFSYLFFMNMNNRIAKRWKIRHCVFNYLRKWAFEAWASRPNASFSVWNELKSIIQNSINICHPLVA